MLLPVRTMFAHQWLTMPQYIFRAYPPAVGDKMEWLVNWINPGIIFIGVPLLTAMTRRANVYTMMIVGSLVSAVPTFLLCGGPNLKVLIVYFVVFSIGEALWSAGSSNMPANWPRPAGLRSTWVLRRSPGCWQRARPGSIRASCWRGTVRQTRRPAQLHTGTLWFIYGVHCHDHAHRPLACPQVGLHAGCRAPVKSELAG